MEDTMSSADRVPGGGVVSLFPAQVDSLRDILTLKDAIALDVSMDTFQSLRVSVYFAGDPSDEDAPPPAARWFSVSVAGTVREQGATPGQVAA
jgi:hypothetical protein